MKFSHSILAWAAITVPVATASFSGIPENFSIRAFSRPCCSFVPTVFHRMLGIAGFIEPSSLGDHDFAHLIKRGKAPAPAGMTSEAVGMIFTCKAGFVDTSHLRDHADWGATVFRELREKLGSGTSIQVGREGSQESSILLPKLSAERRARITDDQIAQIAIALTNDIALFHEMATAFNMAVSMPRVPFVTERVVTERDSAFSVEDAYSNLLGAMLGVESARSPLPFNEAMTIALDRRLNELGARSTHDAEEVFNSLRGTWWKTGGFQGYRRVRRRAYDYVGENVPKIPNTFVSQSMCGEARPEILTVPNVAETTGIADEHVAYVQVIPSRQYARLLRNMGIELQMNAEGKPVLTRARFGAIIPKIQELYRKTIPDLLDYP